VKKKGRGINSALTCGTRLAVKEEVGSGRQRMGEGGRRARGRAGPLAGPSEGGAGALAVQAAYWPSLGRERGEKIGQGDSWAGVFLFFLIFFSVFFS